MRRVSYQGMLGTGGDPPAGIYVRLGEDAMVHLLEVKVPLQPFGIEPVEMLPQLRPERHDRNGSALLHAPGDGGFQRRVQHAVEPVHHRPAVHSRRPEPHVEFSPDRLPHGLGIAQRDDGPGRQ